MSDEAKTDEVTETPTGETVIAPGEGGIPTITPVTERTYPIRNIKLLADAKIAEKAAREARQTMQQQAMVLYGIVAMAPTVFSEVDEKNKEAERLQQRIVADTDGRVKWDDVVGFDFDKARIVLKRTGAN
jgi:hypothetical protein